MLNFASKGGGGGGKVFCEYEKRNNSFLDLKKFKDLLSLLTA